MRRPNRKARYKKRWIRPSRRLELDFYAVQFSFPSGTQVSVSAVEAAPQGEFLTGEAVRPPPMGRTGDRRRVVRLRDGLDLDDSGHRRGAGGRGGAVLPGSVDRRVSHGHEVVAKLSQQVRHLAAVVRHDAGDGRGGGGRAAGRIGHGDLFERVRVAPGARGREADSGSAGRHSVGGVWLPGGGDDLAVDSRRCFLRPACSTRPARASSWGS